MFLCLYINKNKPKLLVMLFIYGWTTKIEPTYGRFTIHCLDPPSYIHSYTTYCRNCHCFQIWIVQRTEKLRATYLSSVAPSFFISILLSSQLKKYKNIHFIYCTNLTILFKPFIYLFIKNESLWETERLKSLYVSFNLFKEYCYNLFIVIRYHTCKRVSLNERGCIQKVKSNSKLYWLNQDKTVWRKKK